MGGGMGGGMGERRGGGMGEEGGGMGEEGMTREGSGDGLPYGNKVSAHLSTSSGL